MFAAVICFSNLPSGPLLYDDPRATGSPCATNGSLSCLFHVDFWGQPLDSPGSHGSFRPVTTLSFRLDHLAHGSWPAGFRLVNLWLHGMCTLLVCKVCRAWLGWGPVRAGLAALIFAVHPVHCDVLCNAVGRSELLCCLFFLAALLAYHRARRRATAFVGLCWLLCTLGLQALSLLSKEHGIMLGPLCVALELLWRFTASSRDRGPPPLSTAWWRAAVLAAGTAALVVGRLGVSGGHQPWLDPLATGATRLPFWPRTGTYLHRMAVHVGFLVFPYHLSHDWSADSLPLVTHLRDPRLVWPVLCIAAALAMVGHSVIRRQRRGGQDHARSVGFAMCFFGATFLMSSNLLVTVGFVVAERVLYLPSVGFAVLVAAYVSALDQHWARNGAAWRKLLWLVVLLAVGAGALRTLARNRDWRSDEALAASTLAHSPDNVKVAVQLSSALLAREQWEVAESLSRRALRLHPEYSAAGFTLFQALSGQSRLPEAERALADAVALHGNYAGIPFFLRRLAVQYANRAPNPAPGAALRLAEQALLIDGSDLAALEIKAYACTALGDHPGAAEANMARSTLRPTDGQAAADAGFALVNVGRNEEAADFLSRAVELRPGDLASWANLGTAYAQLRRDRDAIGAYRKAVVEGDLGSAAVLEQLAAAMVRTGSGRDEVGEVFQAATARHGHLQGDLSRAWARLWANAPPLDSGGEQLAETWGRPMSADQM